MLIISNTKLVLWCCLWKTFLLSSFFHATETSSIYHGCCFKRDAGNVLTAATVWKEFAVTLKHLWASNGTIKKLHAPLLLASASMTSTLRSSFLSRSCGPRAAPLCTICKCACDSWAGLQARERCLGLIRGYSWRGREGAESPHHVNIVLEVSEQHEDRPQDCLRINLPLKWRLIQ